MPRWVILVLVGCLASAVAAIAVVDAGDERTPDDAEVPFVSLYDEPDDGAAQLMVRGDGQFYALLAQDPTLARPEVLHGDHVEGRLAYRALRPGFGWLAWLGSAGQPGLVPWALVVLTVLSTVVLAESVRRLAIGTGSDPRVACAVILLPGVLRLLTWTGPEIAAAACAGLAVVAALERRERAVAGWLVGAVLLRETLLVVAVGLWLARRVRLRTVVAPAVALGVWAALVCLRLGALPRSGSRLELLAVVDAASEWDGAAIVSLGALGVMVALAWRRHARLVAPIVGVHAALGVVMGADVWTFDGFTRVFLPVYAIALALSVGIARQHVRSSTQLPSGSLM